MIKTLLIALILIPTYGISQTKKPIDGFLGIPFGSSRASVIAALNAKGGILDRKESKPDFIVYRGIKLGHREARLFVIKLVNDKAFQADFIFDPILDARAIEYYYSLVNDITEIYGNGESNKKFKEPYSDSDDDGIKISAIKSGNADYTTIWVSPSNNNAISIQIDETLTVTLTYQDSKLIEEAIKQRKEKEKADY